MINGSTSCFTISMSAVASAAIKGRFLEETTAVKSTENNLLHHLISSVALVICR
ncbi:MAG: hypothetical protein ACI3Y9_09500 [Candidatus Cryptobacteroides sp.]